VVLVAGIRDAAIDSEWIRAIGVVGEQSRAFEAIHARCSLFRAEIFSAVIIYLGVGVDTEIVVEGNVLLESQQHASFGVLLEESSWLCADAGHTDRSVIAEAATKAIALVRRRCMGNLSLEFTVLNQWKHRGERTYGKVRT